MFSERKPALKFVWWGVLALFLYISADFAAFTLSCKAYADAVGSKKVQLPKAVLEKEALVVLTGDRKRIPWALALLRERKSPHLIISGTARGATLTEVVNSQANSSQNIQAIWKKIILESSSTSTIENAQESGRILQRLGAPRVILITSEYHMVRSLALFQTLAPGPEYITYPVPSEVTGLFQGQFGQMLEGGWKIFLEYWKYFLFKHYYLRHFAHSPY